MGCAAAMGARCGVGRGERIGQLRALCLALQISGLRNRCRSAGTGIFLWELRAAFEGAGGSEWAIGGAGTEFRAFRASLVDSNHPDTRKALRDKVTWPGSSDENSSVAFPLLPACSLWDLSEVTFGAGFVTVFH